jgi:hypothetical protein
MMPMMFNFAEHHRRSCSRNWVCALHLLDDVHLPMVNIIATILNEIAGQGPVEPLLCVWRTFSSGRDLQLLTRSTQRLFGKRAITVNVQATIDAAVTET